MEGFRNFPARRLTGKFQHATVVASYSPTRFFLHLSDNEEYQKRILMAYTILQDGAKGVHPILEEECFPGAPVLFRISGASYRATILDEYRPGKTFRVWLGDMGIEYDAELSQCFTVPAWVKDVPYLAVLCGLHETRPKKNNTWYRRNVEMSDQLLDERTFTVTVQQHDDHGDAIWVTLEDEETGENPTETLTQQGHAQPGQNPIWYPFEEMDFWGDGNLQKYHYLERCGPHDPEHREDETTTDRNHDETSEDQAIQAAIQWGSDVSAEWDEILGEWAEEDEGRGATTLSEATTVLYDEAQEQDTDDELCYTTDLSEEST